MSTVSEQLSPTTASDGCERVEIRVAATRAVDGVLIERGELVVSGDGLVFRPRHPSDATPPLAWQRRPAVGPSRRPIVVAVSTGARGRLSCPPTLVIEDADGRTVEFAILGRAWSSNCSARNLEARDRAVSVLASVLN